LLSDADTPFIFAMMLLPQLRLFSITPMLMLIPPFAF